MNSLPWLASYDPGVPSHLEYPEKPLAALVEEAAAKDPGRAALIFFGRRVTHGRLLTWSDAFARSLKELGVARGDRVALILPNCPQFAVAYYGLLRLGAAAVPVNPLCTERELEFIFGDAQVKAAVVLDLFYSRAAAACERLDRQGAGAPRLITTSLADFLPLHLALLYHLRQKVPAEPGLSFKQLIDGPGFGPPAPVDVRREPAVILYTAGTTGRPKGVMLSNFALVANAMHCIAWVHVQPEDRFLTVLPIFHGFGMSVGLNAIMIAGGTTVLLPRYRPEDVLHAIARYRVTLFAGVPTMYIGLINHPRLARYDLSSLRGCFVGAAPLPPEVKRRFEKLTGSRLMEGYGLTEAVTAKCCNPYRGTNKEGSIGIPFPDTIMKIVDVETGERDLPPGEAGELVLKSPDIMLGYLNLPEETSRVIRGGWLYTGDIARMDEDGYFYLVERKKDLIITGGFNVYPREVEDVLYEHPAVKEACVVGVPDEYRGEVVKAFVVLREGQVATAEEIIAHCRRHLVPYKVPREVEFRSELPKSAIGKVLRRELREEAKKQ